MFKKLSYLLALSILALGLFTTTPVAALEAGDLVMSISPSEQVIDLEPGQKYDGSITVTNVGRLAFDFTLKAAPYHVNDDNYDPDFSTDNSYTNLKNWLRFPKSVYRLDPGQSVDAEFIVDVPTDAPNGGQYAAIMIQNSAVNPADQEDSAGQNNLVDQDAASNSPLNLQVRAAAVLYGHVQGGELREAAELTNHNLPSFILGDSFSAAATIQNSGNVDFYARQTLSIRNFFTNNEILQPSDTGDESPFTETLIVLPGTTRTSLLNWHLPDTGTFPIGLYRVTQTIVFLDQTHTFERLLFVCPVWLALLLLFLIVLLVIWLVLGLAKRHKTKRQNSTF